MSKGRERVRVGASADTPAARGRTGVLCSGRRSGSEPEFAAMKNCLHCQTEIIKRNTYCSVRCQQGYYQATKIQTWLETGTLQKVGTNREHFTKRYLLEQQQNCCAICGTQNVWLGKLITFVLDHIDGNSENNRRINLRLVCPNCDSQLPTFKSRNKGRGRYKRKIRYRNGLSY